MIESNRPTHKEISGKLRQALKAVKQQAEIPSTNPVNLAADALDLDYLYKEEFRYVLETLLNEIDPADYAGRRPPKRSYEGEISNAELFAFKFFSNKFGRDVYFKFAFDKQGMLWIVSLHEDRPVK